MFKNLNSDRSSAVLALKTKSSLLVNHRAGLFVLYKESPSAETHVETMESSLIKDIDAGLMPNTQGVQHPLATIAP